MCCRCRHLISHSGSDSKSRRRRYVRGPDSTEIDRTKENMCYDPCRAVSAS